MIRPPDYEELNSNLNSPTAEPAAAARRLDFSESYGHARVPESSISATRLPQIGQLPRNTKSTNELVLVIPDETRILKNLRGAGGAPPEASSNQSSPSRQPEPTPPVSAAVAIPQLA